MDGTPIFDELRDLLDSSEDLFGAAGTPPEASPPAEAEKSPPEAREDPLGVGGDPPEAQPVPSQGEEGSPAEGGHPPEAQPAPSQAEGGSPAEGGHPPEAQAGPPRAEEGPPESAEGSSWAAVTSPEAGEGQSWEGPGQSWAAAASPEAGEGPPGLEEAPPEAGRQPAKIVIAGGRGAGKTTFVAALSDADPVTVEAVADFGRIALHPDLVLYLLGTSEPEQAGFGGALGAVVLVDPRRIEDAFATISYFENDSDVPFVVAVNMFDGQLRHALAELREALALGPGVPLTTCDARDPASAAAALQELVSYAISARSNAGSPPPDLPE